MTTRIKAAELHQRVGDVLAQIQYTGEPVIIERRGKPVAAFVSIHHFEQLPKPVTAMPRKQTKEERRAALGRATAVQKMILAQRKGKRVPDSAKVIRKLREERARHVATGR